jgi:ABC-type transport system involved in multi-copper enzyme maturation permease subunit
MAAPNSANIKTLSPLKHWAFLSLLLKELRGSRQLLIAGVWTYWLMPAVLDVAYMIFFERGMKTSMIVWFALLGLGWFYAIIVGAQVVCRDWGQAEEHFLRAQPVSPRSIVWAKWWAGLLVLFLVCLVNITWTVVLGAGDPTTRMSGLTDPLTLFALFVILLARREGKATTTRQLAGPATAALAIAFAVLFATAGGRFLLEAALGLPAAT